MPPFQSAGILDAFAGYFWKLNENREPVPATFLEAAALLGDIGRRRVGRTSLPDGREVSTVFMPVDREDRRFFETGIKTSEGWGIVERYASWVEAEAGHARWVEALLAEPKPN